MYTHTHTHIHTQCSTFDVVIIDVEEGTQRKRWEGHPCITNEYCTLKCKCLDWTLRCVPTQPCDMFKVLLGGTRVVEGASIGVLSYCRGIN